MLFAEARVLIIFLLGSPDDAAAVSQQVAGADPAYSAWISTPAPRLDESSPRRATSHDPDSFGRQ
jgi:hypothetical protein